MKISTDYRDFQHKALKESDTWYCTHVLRKISTRISWTIVKKWPQITPNQVTVIGGSLGIIGALILAIPSSITLIIGSLVLLLWTILDALDGEIARFTGNLSITGAFLDNAFDQTILILIFGSLTIHLVFIYSNFMLIVLGIFSIIFFTLCRLLLGLRSENLLKKNIHLAIIGGGPIDELQKYKKKSSSFLDVIGLFVVDLYLLMITNYNIVHITLLFSILDIILNSLIIYSIIIPFFSIPVVIYSFFMPLFFIALLIGYYMELNHIEQKIQVDE